MTWSFAVLENSTVTEVFMLSGGGVGGIGFVEPQPAVMPITSNKLRMNTREKVR